MKKTKFFAVTAMLLFVLILSSCGTSVAPQVVTDSETQIFSVDTNDVRKIMLGTYYVTSEDDMEREIAQDFDAKLLFLAKNAECWINMDEIEAEKVALAESAAAEADQLGISVLEYAGSVGYRTPYYVEGSQTAAPESPDYYSAMAKDRVLMRAMVWYLAELWDIEADAAEIESFMQSGSEQAEAEATVLKNAVMDYSVSNSKISASEKSIRQLIFKTKLLKLFTTDTQLSHEIYVIAEDGYAAVYTTAEEVWQSDIALEPYEGERIWGTTSSVSVSRVSGDDGWEYLIERSSGGKLGVLKFDRWVTANGADRDAFVAIYGTEPHIHP